MEDFYRQNSADEDKKLAASLVGDRYFPQHMSSALAVRYEFVNSSLAYVGEALPETAADEVGWRIKRLDTSADGDVTVLYAEQSADFDKVWDNRTIYTY